MICGVFKKLHLLADGQREHRGDVLKLAHKLKDRINTFVAGFGDTIKDLQWNACRHHLLSHTDTADWLKVNQFFVEQVAYIARKLDAKAPPYPALVRQRFEGGGEGCGGLTFQSSLTQSLHLAIR